MTEFLESAFQILYREQIMQRCGSLEQTVMSILGQ